MDISIVLPTYNEEEIISQKIDQLFNFCQKKLISYQWSVVIADNGSSDKTLAIVQQKSLIYPELKYFHLDQPLKGGAIKKAWQNYPAQVNIFMDADLSTDLEFIPALIETISKQGYDLAIGSRLRPESRVKRSWLRSLTSRLYNFILKLFFNLNLTDVQCGFKAVSKKVVFEIISKIKNNGLFFDTELLVLANYYHFLIKEIPVIWREEKIRKTKIKIIKTALDYLKELIKLKVRLTKIKHISNLE